MLSFFYIGVYRHPPSGVPADRVQIQQLFLKLVRNAVDAVTGQPSLHRELNLAIEATTQKRRV